jgi:nanoRNase/pAp phosphatase (c-di-AMP/oligoRNAs hydrolase)
VDVSRLAERFGGGGHPLACGATLPLPLHQARETVLAALQEWLRPSLSPDAPASSSSPPDPTHR